MAGRNPDASKPNRGIDGSVTNDFTNPVGSVGNSSYREGPIRTDRNYTVYGEGGKIRHQGNFNNSNPYFEQLMLASNNQDKDALYELAVQWEADYANLNEQRDYNREVLEEQREYDSPVNQIARARAAGINPDISGSSGSGSGSGSQAQMQIPAMADQTGQTKFSNAYDNANLAIQGINTAVSAVSSVVGLGNSVIQGIDILSTLPSRIKLQQSSANLHNAEANSINQLLPEKVTGAKLSNAGTILDNASKTVNNIGEMASWFTNESTDDQMSSVFNTLGFSAEQIPGLISGVREFQSNPKMQEYYVRNKTAARDAAARDRIYTDKIMENLYSGAVKERMAEQRYKTVSSNFQTSLMEALNEQNYAELSADATILDLQTNMSSDELQAAIIAQDLESFMQVFQDRDTAIARLETISSDIEKKCKEQGREPNEVERATIDANRVEIMRLQAARSEEVYGLYDILQGAIASQTLLDANVKDNGKFKRGHGQINRLNQSLNAIMGKYLDGEMSYEDLGQQIYDNVLRGIYTLNKSASTGNDIVRSGSSGEGKIDWKKAAQLARTLGALVKN